MAETEAPAPIARDYIVHGPSGEVTVTAITDIEVGAKAELILLGADGGCAAIIAPGHWWHARVSADPADTDA